MYPYNYPYNNDFLTPYNNPYNNINQQAVQSTGGNAPGVEVAYVPTINHVEQVQLQPGQRKIIMIQNEYTMATRVADSMGLVNTEYYRLVKFNPAENNNTITANTANFVTQEQLETRLNAVMQDILSSITGGKNEEKGAETI
jgi:hypothetical protein